MHRKIFQMVGLFLLPIVFAACNDDDGNSKKAVKSLTEDVLTKAPSAESAGHFVNFIKSLKQAEGLDSVRQCKAAQKIYCEIHRAVRENDGPLKLCNIIEQELYGGSFPTFGKRACMTLADDKLRELAGKEQELHRICRELISMRCE